MESNVFRDRLAKLLKEKGLSQKQLAIRANVTESAISHYMRGDRRPRGLTLQNLATELGTTPEYLLGNE